jgi:transcriptional regulator with XRE-family HTH domain
VSNFGDLVKRLRKERGLTLEQVAKKIGSHKGYVSGIENDKVNPPSVKIIRKFARLFAQDEKNLVRIAWADKAPAIIRDDARRVMMLAETEGAAAADLVQVSLLNTLESGYPVELGADGRPRPTTNATLVLPKGRSAVELAATVADDSMEQQAGPGYSRGDVVLLGREEKMRSGSVVFVLYKARQKSQGLVRQIMLEQGDNIVLQPLNKEYPLEFLTHDDIDAVYRVVGKIEMFETAVLDVKV